MRATLSTLLIPLFVVSFVGCDPTPAPTGPPTDPPKIAPPVNDGKEDAAGKGKGGRRGQSKKPASGATPSVPD